MSDFGLVISRQAAPSTAFHLVISRPGAPPVPRPTRQALELHWDAVPTTRQALELHWDAAIPTRQALELHWGAATPTRQALELHWEASFPSRQALRLHWDATRPTRQALRLRWDATRPTRQALRLRWDAAPQTRRALILHWDDATRSASQTRVAIAGRPVHPTAVHVTEDAAQAAITATLDFARPLPAALVTPGAAVVLDVWGIRYDLLVESYSRRREFGVHTWTITASSAAARLQGRYATPVTAALSGPASRIAARLADPIPLDWRMVDWDVAPTRLTADGAAPLDVLRDLVSAAGGRLVSDRDGTLIAMPWPPSRPEDWPGRAEATVDSLASMLSLTDDDEAGDIYNAVTVSDEGASGAELRLEEDSAARRGTVTDVLVYRVPWSADVDVRHCGADVVVLADRGVEERVIEDERLEIVDGTGRTQYPVYAVLAHRWSVVDLGDITAAEDGTITAATPGESLLYVTYRTRARRYRVDLGDASAEPLMLVAED